MAAKKKTPVQRASGKSATKKTKTAVKAKTIAKAKPNKPAMKTKSAAKSSAKPVVKVSAKHQGPAKPVASAKSTVSAAKLDSLTPLDDRLIVQPEAAVEQTTGGIYIPTTVGTRPSRGTVLAKGRGKRNKKGHLRPLDVNVGDQVMFAEFAGTKIMVDGSDVLILREEEVLGILT